MDLQSDSTDITIDSANMSAAEFMDITIDSESLSCWTSVVRKKRKLN